MSLTKELLDEIQRANAPKSRNRAATDESSTGRSVLIDVKPGSEPACRIAQEGRQRRMIRFASPLQWIMTATGNHRAAQAVRKERETIDSPGQYIEIKTHKVKLGLFGRMAPELLQSASKCGNSRSAGNLPLKPPILDDGQKQECNSWHRFMSIPKFPDSSMLAAL